MKLDKIVMFISLIVIAAFVYFLPKISDLTRNTAANNVIESEKIPTSVVCERDYSNGDASIVQNATYIIVDKIVESATIRRTYTFKDADSYTKYKGSISTNIITGITDSYTYNDTNNTITEDILIVVENVSREDLSASFNNFPRTYDNLLKYTEAQKCTSNY